MNWRCIRHPLAGGAEVYTHEIAKRLARQGHEIILITSRPKGLPEQEVIDGYKVIRTGGKYTVYLKAKKIYKELKENGWKPDIIIDEVNTIPFMTPLYTEESVVMLIHQLCRECWKYAVHPLAYPLGWWLEKTLHKPYIKAAKQGKVKAVITVSESTKKDLIMLGYPEEKIHIVPNGINPEKYLACKEYSRDKQDLIVYIGRITPYKRIEDILQAWKQVEQKYPTAKLVIAGRPDKKYLEKLKKQARKLGLKRVEFKTNITHHQKLELLGHAKALIYTSIREGWGQTIMEAALCNTPTIAYNIPGLKDAINHLQTGTLIPPGKTTLLAKTILKTLNTTLDPLDLEETIQEYTWDNSTKLFIETIIEVIKR